MIIGPLWNNRLSPFEKSIFLLDTKRDIIKTDYVEYARIELMFIGFLIALLNYHKITYKIIVFPA